MNGRHELADLKARVDAATFARDRYSIELNNQGRGRCPLSERHNNGDRDPSLQVHEGSIKCWSQGCFGEKGVDVFGLVMVIDSVGLTEAKRIVADFIGKNSEGSHLECSKPQHSDHRLYRDATKRTEVALRLWRETRPAAGTLVETYLGARGISVAPPCTIRFGTLNHSSGGHWPSMVAMVTNGVDDTPLAIHRTFLARDGSGKAPVDPQKMMLGPCRGGAVRLAPVTDGLMVGEGIESCLSAMQATGRPAWAALSTSGLRTLDLPEEVREVTVLADGDRPGGDAAQEAGVRWRREGRCVRIARPPCGCDFNDLLRISTTDRTGGGV